VRDNETWTYNGNGIDIVDSFNYLGYVLSSNGSAKRGIDALAPKAIKFMNNLSSITKVNRNAS
jgi:hypothetical protein